MRKLISLCLDQRNPTPTRRTPTDNLIQINQDWITWSNLIQILYFPSNNQFSEFNPTYYANYDQITFNLLCTSHSLLSSSIPVPVTHSCCTLLALTHTCLSAHSLGTRPEFTSRPTWMRSSWPNYTQRYCMDLHRTDLILEWNCIRQSWFRFKTCIGESWFRCTVRLALERVGLDIQKVLLWRGLV